MSVRYDPTAYTYISARVRSLENSLITRSQLEKMLAADNSNDAFAVLKENGFDFGGNINMSVCEELLLGALKKGFADLEKGMPVPEIIDIFKYPYDCSNIKSAIKCEIRDIDPSPLLFDIGSVDKNVTVKSIANRDFSVFPKNMAAAIPEAIQLYGKTKDPQKIDFIIDRACFCDIDDAAKASKIPFIKELCSSKADFTNFIICIRIIRMKFGEYGIKLVENTLVNGGVIDISEFREAFASGEKELFALIGNKYPYIQENCKPFDDLEKIEKVCDDFRLNKAREGKYVTYGVEIPAAYIIALENEIQNIRIVLAGKEAGIATDKIRERLRECYV